MIFGLFDQLFPLMFTVIFLIVIGTFIYTAVTGLTTWHKNNQSPRLTVPAKVVAKRQNTTHHSHPAAGDASGAHGFHSTTSTSYYVTFEVESGDRMEFAVRGQDYGMLVEGDTGRLSFQETRFLDFERYRERFLSAEEDETLNLKEGAGKLKSDVPALAMALKDAGTPTAAKTLAGITVAYALSPIDLILDFVPVLGYLDDVVL